MNSPNAAANLASVVFLKVQEFARRPLERIAEEPDLHDVESPRHAGHRLIVRGSHWRISRRETRNSQGFP